MATIKRHPAGERTPVSLISARGKQTTPNDSELMQRMEELINTSKNRYRVTVQVANRAKRRRYEDFDDMDDSSMKPICRAILEMYDEMTQPEIIGDED